MKLPARLRSIPEDISSDVSTIISELSGLADADESDSMETQMGDFLECPKCPCNYKPQSHAEQLGVLILMMGQLLECVSMAPLITVHVCVEKCAKKLGEVSHLIYTKPQRKVSTEEIVKVLILHQSIK